MSNDTKPDDGRPVPEAPKPSVEQSGFYKPIASEVPKSRWEQSGHWLVMVTRPLVGIAAIFTVCIQVKTLKEFVDEGERRVRAAAQREVGDVKAASKDEEQQRAIQSRRLREELQYRRDTLAKQRTELRTVIRTVIESKKGAMMATRLLDLVEPAELDVGLVWLFHDDQASTLLNQAVTCIGEIRETTDALGPFKGELENLKTRLTCDQEEIERQNEELQRELKSCPSDTDNAKIEKISVNKRRIAAFEDFTVELRNAAKERDFDKYEFNVTAVELAAIAHLYADINDLEVAEKYIKASQNACVKNKDTGKPLDQEVIEKVRLKLHLIVAEICFMKAGFVEEDSNKKGDYSLSAAEPAVGLDYLEQSAKKRFRDIVEMVDDFEIQSLAEQRVMKAVVALVFSDQAYSDATKKIALGNKEVAADSLQAAVNFLTFPDREKILWFVDSSEANLENYDENDRDQANDAASDFAPDLTYSEWTAGSTAFRRVLEGQYWKIQVAILRLELGAPGKEKHWQRYLRCQKSIDSHYPDADLKFQYQVMHAADSTEDWDPLLVKVDALLNGSGVSPLPREKPSLYEDRSKFPPSENSQTPKAPKPPSTKDNSNANVRELPDGGSASVDESAQSAVSSPNGSKSVPSVQLRMPLQSVLRLLPLPAQERFSGSVWRCGKLLTGSRTDRVLFSIRTSEDSLPTQTPVLQASVKTWLDYDGDSKVSPFHVSGTASATFYIVPHFAENRLSFQISEGPSEDHTRVALTGGLGRGLQNSPLTRPLIQKQIDEQQCDPVAIISSEVFRIVNDKNLELKTIQQESQLLVALQSLLKDSSLKANGDVVLLSADLEGATTPRAPPDNWRASAGDELVLDIYQSAVGPLLKQFSSLKELSSRFELPLTDNSTCGNINFAPQVGTLHPQINAIKASVASDSLRISIEFNRVQSQSGLTSASFNVTPECVQSLLSTVLTKAQADAEDKSSSKDIQQPLVMKPAEISVTFANSGWIRIRIPFDVNRLKLDLKCLTCTL